MMRLTIIAETQSVGKDGVFYDHLDLSSCGIPANVWALQWNESQGHIEFNTTIPNEEILSLPDWATNCLERWDVANTPVPLTPEQILLNNKMRAEDLLFESDWSMLLDVPLANKPEWEAYRSALRNIAISPTLEPVWPVKPTSIWQ